ncbi:DUF1801 domain-containing protein [Herbiconiux sp. CPCC 205716]|uniref:DUF1801 domain-containing protein n=1 Tax=Herbiconiux gentiana TaxID=2970912 RepID=A0ABT2GEQ1_9MICO|nr:DUF1801 domain-containing protein [Herbiconiux gentiana]MCS5713281.1 DUF1801 domain-containing protein [Herbiconiux gentiana]
MSAAGGSDGGFSAEERAAMKSRAAELRAEAKSGKAAEKAAADAAAVEGRIAEMPAPDRAMAERLHALVAEAAPALQPKLYYGQPGWASAGKVVVFFRSGLMDKARYSTLGFSENSALGDPAGFWPTSYALERLDEEAAARIRELIVTAAG